jgi:hypothetical protein
MRSTVRWLPRPRRYGLGSRPSLDSQRTAARATWSDLKKSATSMVRDGGVNASCSDATTSEGRPVSPSTSSMTNTPLWSRFADAFV